MQYNDIINSERIVIIFHEGEGSYGGKAQDLRFHPFGRMGALVNVFLDGSLVYSTDNASTLPDSLSELYSNKYNGGSPIPTIYEGVFPIYAKLHNGKSKAFELKKGTQTVNVIRDDLPSTSYAINIHKRRENDSTSYASSCGCLTILEEDLLDIFDILGIRSFNGEYVGRLIIDRGNMCSNLIELYKGVFLNMYENFASENVQGKKTLNYDEIINTSDLSESGDWILQLKNAEKLSDDFPALFGLFKYHKEFVEKIFERGRTYERNGK